MVRTLRFDFWGPGSIPDGGTKIPTSLMMQPKTTTTTKFQCELNQVNEFKKKKKAKHSKRKKSSRCSVRIYIF